MDHIIIIQCTLGLVLVSPSFLYGLNISYATVALPQMSLDLNEASWFGSIALFVSPISSLVVGIIIDSFGRKTALLYGILPSVLGWTLLFSTSRFELVLVGQALNGLTIGAVSYPMQVYAGECVMVHSVWLRNAFMEWIAVGSSLGTVGMLLLANYLTSHQICGVCMTLSAVTLAAFVVLLPESPTWLYHRGRIGDAELSQRKLRIAQPILAAQVDGEAAAGAAAAAAANVPPPKFTLSTATKHVKKLARRDVRVPLWIMSTMSLLYEFSGSATTITYMIDIIDDNLTHVQTTYPAVWRGLPAATASASSSSVEYHDAYKYTVICGIAMCAGSLLSSFLVPSLGVRRGFIVSCVGSAFGMATLTGAGVALRRWQRAAFAVRVAAVTLITFLAGVSLGPSMAVTGDVFPVDAKGFGGVVDMVGYFADGVSNKCFLYLYATLAAYTYLVFAVVGVLCAAYTYRCLPEVVGKTLNDIQSEMKNSRKLIDD